MERNSEPRCCLGSFGLIHWNSPAKSDKAKRQTQGEDCSQTPSQVRLGELSALKAHQRQSHQRSNKEDHPQMPEPEGGRCFGSDRELEWPLPESGALPHNP